MYNQYHLQGILRNPLRTGLFAEIMHNNANLSGLYCITICYEKIFKSAFLNYNRHELFWRRGSFACFLNR
ncbi:TPA: hypothetical protein JD365_16845 [Citrobacter amalonaticus]|nr:hypothetical protein [Citrobacter amalonaticus]